MLYSQESCDLNHERFKMNIYVVLLSKDSKGFSPLRKINLTFGKEEKYAVFKITRLIYDKHRNPLEYSYNYINPKYYSIKIDAD